MAYQTFAEYAIYVSPDHGVYPVPHITVADGSASGDGVILRACLAEAPMEKKWRSFIAGEAFAASSEQILAYLGDDGKLYKCRSVVHTMDNPANMASPHSRNLFIVDMSRESGAVNADSTLSHVIKYRPVGVNEINIETVENVAECYSTVIRDNRYPVEAVAGSIISNEGKLFQPTSLFRAATKTGTATEITDFNIMPPTANVEITDASHDYTQYEQDADGNPQYAIILKYSTSTVAVLGFIGSIVKAGNVYTLSIKNAPVGGTTGWLGNATDKANDYTSNCDAWYIVPVGDNTLEDAVAIQPDDAADTGNQIVWSDEQCGFVYLNDSSSADTLVYNQDFLVRIPSSSAGDGWVGEYEHKVPLIHTMVITSDGDGSGNFPVISGHFKRG